MRALLRGKLKTPAMPRETTSYRDARDEALYKCFKRALRSNQGLSENEALRIALRERQPRLWLSFHGVYRIVLRIAKGEHKPQKHTARKDAVRHILRKYLHLRRQPAFRDSSCLLLTSFIMAEPSEGFMLSLSYAKRIIWRKRKQRQNLWRRRAAI